MQCMCAVGEFHHFVCITIFDAPCASRERICRMKRRSAAGRDKTADMYKRGRICTYTTSYSHFKIEKCWISARQLAMLFDNVVKLPEAHRSHSHTLRSKR